jgi:hypothetical protein
MNLAEASAMRALIARVESLERAVNDANRRIDELSAAERKRTERETNTLSLKKASNG